jgi:hypothetical protein
MHLLFGLDAMVCIVLQPPGRQGDNQKRYRFTPPVSKWRIPERLSVDALCGFGAKNLNRCTEFIQWGHLADLNTSLLISHFGALCKVIGSVMVRAGEKCLMSGRGADRSQIFLPFRQGLVVKHATIAGMLPSCRLVRFLWRWALS